MNMQERTTTSLQESNERGVVIACAVVTAFFLGMMMPVFSIYSGLLIGLGGLVAWSHLIHVAAMRLSLMRDIRRLRKELDTKGLL